MYRKYPEANIMKKKILVIIAVLLVSIFLVSCGSAPESKDASNNQGGINLNRSDYASYEATDSSKSTNNVVIDTNQKIVYTAKYTFETQDGLKTKNEITNEVLRLGGYISSSTENRYIYIDYKVPTEKLNGFLDFMDSLEGVGNKSISTEDITSTYSKTQARIETLEASKLAYENLLKESNLSYADIIQINRELNDINTELANYRNMKDLYDNKLDYSLVTVIIYTDDSYTEPSFFAQYIEYLGDLFVGFGKGVLYVLPVALICFGIFSAIFFPIRSAHKKKKALQASEPETQNS